MGERLGKIGGGRKGETGSAVRQFVMHNAEMKTVVYCCLGMVFVACVCLAIFFLHECIGKEKGPALTGLTAVLAVIAAVIAVLPALRVVEIQEDSQRPRPTPYFDLTSRYDLLQLRVKNFGASTAYDVHLKWKTRPVNHKGNEVQSLDSIAVLMPQESVSTLVGTSHDMVRKLSDTHFEGECQYKDASGKKYSHKFICSVDANLKQLIYDNELPKTLRELQDIPKELARIADLLQKANDKLND